MHAYGCERALGMGLVSPRVTLALPLFSDQMAVE
jgi:hypothetical protein